MTSAPPTLADGFDDAAHARAAAGGDRSAFAAIYDRYADRLHDFCAGMLRDRDAAADCVQDVFVTAATRLAQLREPDRLRSWLYAIARNEALARIRARRREAPTEYLPEMASSEPDLATLAARSELADLISEACGGLTDRDRVVLELAYRERLAGPELAGALGVSHKNANTLVERVRTTIERSLGALLVCRRVNADPGRCPELAILIGHWDGQFTVLLRKRAARHIDSCPACDEDRSRMVNPVALLGSVPVFLPAPAWLREHTLTDALNILPPSTAAPSTPVSHPDGGTSTFSGANDPSVGAASHSTTDQSWWPPADLDTADLSVPARVPHAGSAPHPPTSRRLSRALVGIGLVAVGLVGAALLAIPEMYRVAPTYAPGGTATTTPASATPMAMTSPIVTPTTSAPLTITPGPGGGGPTVPSTAPTTSAPLTITPGPGGGGPTVPSTAPTTSAPLTVTPGPGGGGPTVPPSTVAATTPPSITTPPGPTSNPPTKAPLGPTGLNPPSREDPSDGTCPPITCATDGPFR